MDHAHSAAPRAPLGPLLPTLLAALPLAVFPLWNDLSYAHITKGKWEGLLYMAALMALVTGGALLWRLLRHRHLPRVRLSLPHLFALGYLAFAALSARWGTYSAEPNARGEPTWLMGYLRYEGLAALLLYLLVFLLCSLGRPNWTVLLAIIAASFTGFCAVVALQYAGLNPLGLFPAGLSTRTNYEFQGTIGNIDMVSGYVAVVLPMLLGGYLVQGRRQPWLLLAGSLGVLLTLCMEVQSGLIYLGALLVLVACAGLCRREWRARALWILALAALAASVRRFLRLPWLDGTGQVCFLWSTSGLAVALVALALAVAAVTLGQRGPVLRVRWVVLALAAAALASLLALALVEVPASLGGLHELSEVLHGRAQDSFGSYRLGVWRCALAIAADHPLFGTGPDTFLYALRDKLLALGTSFPETFDNPHNEYLALASNLGFPALACYLGLVGSAVWLALRALRRGGDAVLIPLLGVACYLIQAFFCFSICLVAPIFWAALGTLCAMAGRQDAGAVQAQGTEGGSEPC